MILGLDPFARELREHYDAIVGEAVVPDPQDVPAGVLGARSAPSTRSARSRRACGSSCARRASAASRAGAGSTPCAATVKRDLGVSVPRRAARGPRVRLTKRPALRRSFCFGVRTGGTGTEPLR